MSRVRVEIPDSAFGGTSPEVDTPVESATTPEHTEIQPEQSPAQEAAAPDRAIPYDRFKEVVDERNTFKQELASLKAEVERLKQPAPQPQPVNIPEDNTPASRLARLEFAEAERQLERDVAAALREFPEVPEAILYRAIAADGTASPLDVARNYTAFVDTIRKDALAGVQAQVQKAPPPQVRPSTPAPPTQPKSLTEAHQLARKAFAGIQW